MTTETDLCAAERRCARLARRTGRRRIEWIAEDPQLVARPKRGAPRPNHSSLRPRIANRISAAVAARAAIARPVTISRAGTAGSAADMPIRIHTSLRGGAGHVLAVVVGAIDLPRHVDCSEAVAAGSSAASRDAIRCGVTTREVPGKDAGPCPAGSPRLSRPNANCAIGRACGATALAGYARQPVRAAARGARPAVVQIRLKVRAGPVAVDLIRGAADPRRPALGAVSVLAELTIRT